MMRPLISFLHCTCNQGHQAIAMQVRDRVTVTQCSLNELHQAQTWKTECLLDVSAIFISLNASCCFILSYLYLFILPLFLPQVVELISGGAQIAVNNENKMHYLNLLAQYRLASQVRDEVEHFLKGIGSHPAAVWHLILQFLLIWSPLLPWV